MRGFLIFLLFAAPVAMASPVFWSLMRMNFASEEVVYIEHDGTAQHATLGPLSAWPDWALRPANATIDVQSRFDATPRQPAMGLAHVRFDGDQRDVVTAYERGLAARGFSVASYTMRTSSADLPPEPFTLCVVEGVTAKPARTLRLSFSVDSDVMPPSLHWTEGKAVPMIGMTPDACF